MKRTKKPPKEKLIPVPMTAKELFAIVRKFFTLTNNYADIVSYDERAAAWDVLSALRGPDNGDSDLKRATTAVIRSRLTAKQSDSNGILAMVARDSQASAELRAKLQPVMDEKHYHFYKHAKNAFAALGLKWDENNDPPKKKKK